jgi:hypothetical protein
MIKPKELTIHWMPAMSVCKDDWMAGSAKLTDLPSSATMPLTKTVAARIHFPEVELTLYWAMKSAEIRA